MHRRIGVSAVKGRKTDMEKYNKLGKEMEDAKISKVKDLMDVFQTALTDFASKHRDRINRDPEFRMQFHKMCISVGVDPLASNKGFWADLLGVGDFYFELGVKIIEITVQTRSLNGGIMNLKEVLSILQTRVRQNVIEEDVVRAIEKVQTLGSGFRLARLGRNTVLISVPMEINSDHEILMTVAQSHDGMFSLDIMISLHGWTLERFNYLVVPLLQDGMIWVDQHEGNKHLFFFCKCQ